MRFKTLSCIIVLLCIPASIYIFMRVLNNPENFLLTDKWENFLPIHSNDERKLKENIKLEYNFYSHIHRFMRSQLSNFEAFLAKIDFTDKEQRTSVINRFKELIELLNKHAEHEDKVYHAMLIQKGSKVHVRSIEEHQQQEKQIIMMRKILESIVQSAAQEKQTLLLGYYFYLAYTSFQSNYLRHLITEETVLMPELTKLYSENELRSITFNTYKKMSQDEINNMLEVLFPYVNTMERQVFLKDIKDGTPEKFNGAWKFISSKLEPKERKILETKLNIKNS